MSSQVLHLDLLIIKTIAYTDRLSHVRFCGAFSTNDHARREGCGMSTHIPAWAQHPHRPIVLRSIRKESEGKQEICRRRPEISWLCYRPLACAYGTQASIAYRSSHENQSRQNEMEMGGAPATIHWDVYARLRCRRYVSQNRMGEKGAKRVAAVRTREYEAAVQLR